MQVIFLGHISRLNLIKEINKLYLYHNSNLLKTFTEIQKK